MNDVLLSMLRELKRSSRRLMPISFPLREGSLPNRRTSASKKWIQRLEACSQTI